MAAPTVFSTYSMAVSTAGTDHQFGPVAGASDGRLLLAFLRSASGVGFSGPTVGGGGWSLLLSDASDPTDDRVEVWYKVASGDTAVSFFTFTTATATKSIGWLYFIDDFNAGELADLSNIATNIGVSPQAYPTLTPPEGSQDYLWIWFGSREGEATSTGLPTNMTSSGQMDTGISGASTVNCMGASARTASTAASFTPTGTPSNVQVSLLMAIHPVSITTLSVTPVVFDLGVPAPTLAQPHTFEPGPIVLDLGVPAPLLTQPTVFEPGPITLDFGVPAPLLDSLVTFTVGPIALTLGVPEPDFDYSEPPPKYVPVGPDIDDWDRAGDLPPSKYQA